ncbi:MAG: EAL domain-containing protein [Solirubrobacteraceae bacterium]
MTLELIPDGPAAQAQAPGCLPAGRQPDVFEQLFDRVGGMLAIVDEERRFVAVNRACERVLGWEPEVLVGQSLLDCVEPHDPLTVLESPDQLHAGAPWPAHTVELLARHRHKDGSWRWLLWSGSAQGQRWYASARDVTEWIRLEHRVGRDPLTLLPNREVFSSEVTRALARHERSSEYLAVLFIDIDSFKQVNDSLGHVAGDRLLAQVAERLRGSVRGGDVVGRLGGDEFVILAETLESELDVVAVARRALAAFDEPLDIGSGPIVVSASIGVATGTGPTSTADSLLHEADMAMYRAKALGANRFAMFDAALRGDVERRLEVERDLRTALAGNEFTLHYQPVVSLADGRVVGCEALVRWQHRRRGILAADEFMAFAEQNGLVVPLGAWALRTAAAQAASWHGVAGELVVSVNVSPRQLTDDGFVASVRKALDDAQLPPACFCLEVPETAVLADPPKARARLTELRGLGVQVAFDDFGTGYSSLLHLVQLPVDLIKLERTFVSGLSATSAQRHRAVLIAVTGAARELGITVVADGVEQEGQLAELIAAGCERAQGNLFAPALPAADVSFESYRARVAGRTSGRQPSRR